MKALAIQTLIATVIWGLGMHFLFDWPREKLLMPMIVFAGLYWGASRLLGLIIKKDK